MAGGSWSESCPFACATCALLTGRTETTRGAASWFDGSLGSRCGAGARILCGHVRLSSGARANESEGGGALPLRGESAWTKTHGTKTSTHERTKGNFSGPWGREIEYAVYAVFLRGLC